MSCITAGAQFAGMGRHAVIADELQQWHIGRTVRNHMKRNLNPVLEGTNGNRWGLGLISTWLCTLLPSGLVAALQLALL